MNRRLRANKGFTLIEILASIAIISLGLVPILNILPEGMESMRKVERLTFDVFLAQYKIEEIRSQILGTDPSYGFAKAGGYGGSGTFTGYSNYKYTVTDDNGIGIKELSVTVWFDDDGDGVLDSGEESIRLDTKVAER
ncbi:MAG: type II secretion system protein [Candidatus Omnitrophica bacterium]|nr:type II secretion system protein [Candidatus Omnitrophota bacterium]